MGEVFLPHNLSPPDLKIFQNRRSPQRGALGRWLKYLQEELPLTYSGDEPRRRPYRILRTTDYGPLFPFTIFNFSFLKLRPSLFGLSNFSFGHTIKSAKQTSIYPKISHIGDKVPRRRMGRGDLSATGTSSFGLRAARRHRRIFASCYSTREVDGLI